MPPAHAVSVCLRPEVSSGIISLRNPAHDATVLPPSTGLAPAGHRTSVSHERTYYDHLELINSVITLICRRKQLQAADAADFRQDVHLKLLTKGTLDKYDGRGSLRSFLLIVVAREYKDFRIRTWGKWRPSVEAQRHGPVAILLERLIVRDGLTFEQALETLATNHQVTRPRKELEALAARLPLRVTRRAQSEEVLVTVPATGPSPDMLLSREELQSRAAEVRQALLDALRDLDPEERLIIKLRYMDGLKVVQIARMMQREPKPLYRAIEQLLAGLRRTLEARGVDTKGLFDDEEPWA